MIRTAKAIFTSVRTITTFTNSLLTFGSSEFDNWVADRKEALTAIKQEYNSTKVELILSKLEDLQELDLPIESKKLIEEKLNALLVAELTPTEVTGTTVTS